MTSISGNEGTVTFQYSNAPEGIYSTTVTNVSAPSLTWDEITPDNSYTK